VPGLHSPVEREGFKARCELWDGDVCLKPWLVIPRERVVDPTGDDICIDDATSFRPVWYFNDGEEEAQTFCWIATGSSRYESFTRDATKSEECGWMFGGFSDGNHVNPTCNDDAARPSEVDMPGPIGNIVWSFELMSECRAGSFTAMECNWPR
jgi:hypothetical protein